MTVSKINSPSVLVTAEDIKSNVPSIKDAVKAKLRVDCSTTSALDIGAAAVGLNSYQAFKGQTDKVFVQLRANLGNMNAPCYTFIDLGFFSESSHSEMYAKGKEALENCDSIMTWEILKNGEECGMRFKSNEDHEGLRLTVTINGETYSDLKYSLEEVTRLVNEEYHTGFDSNDTADFNFCIEGDELVANIDNDESEYFIIIDDNGLIDSFDDSRNEEAQDAFNEAGDFSADIESWAGDLRLLQQVDLCDDEETYIAINSDHKVEYEMTGEELTEILKRDPSKYGIYQELYCKR